MISLNVSPSLNTNTSQNTSQNPSQNPYLLTNTTQKENMSTPLLESQMNILYYSNFCKYSQKVVQYLVKAGLGESIRFICIDQRKKDSLSSQTHVILENGNKTLLPPNIYSVPSLLLISEKFRVIIGDEIIKFYQPKTISTHSMNSHTEPSAFDLTNVGNSFIVSEKFTYYNAPNEELGVSGEGTTRQMHNYVKAIHEPSFINTPPDTYRPDKISTDLTLDILEKKRTDDFTGSNSMFI